ncbi:hypothetical protein F3Y22_tig00110123pilonHSYRG00061 [Hibiscus syriacus]|uniref:Uncharacterized protein n=1 Tax=Hibiscus syriacus TaxID=106335 RepID=A0A6A3BN86_HIBSY|nr:hypothetical protein F3Y22_tig00110123pilonHSYRG00061 [Hibiscus syriacus]
MEQGNRWSSGVMNGSPNRPKKVINLRRLNRFRRTRRVAVEANGGVSATNGRKTVVSSRLWGG